MAKFPCIVASHNVSYATRIREESVHRPWLIWKMARSTLFFLLYLGPKCKLLTIFPFYPLLGAGKFQVLWISFPKSSKWEPSGKDEAYGGRRLLHEVQNVRSYSRWSTIYHGQRQDAHGWILFTKRMHREDLENHWMKFPSPPPNPFNTEVRWTNHLGARGLGVYDVALTWQRSRVRFSPSPPVFLHL